MSNATTQCNFYLTNVSKHGRISKNGSTQTLKPRTKHVAVQARQATVGIYESQIKKCQSSDCATQTVCTTKYCHKASSTSSNENLQSSFVDWMKFDIFSHAVRSCHFLKLEYRFAFNCHGEGVMTISNLEHFGLMGYNMDIMQVVISSTGICNVFVTFKPVDTFSLLSTDNVIQVDDLQQILVKLKGHNYVFCPGIKISGADVTQHVQVFTSPFLRYQDQKCSVWFEKMNPCKRIKVSRCESCVKLANTVKMFLKRKSEETPTRKAKRIKVDSHCNISALTPKSKNKRLTSIRKARLALSERVRRLEKQLEHRNILLDSTQSEELTEIVDLINTNHEEDLMAVLNETGNNSELLEQVWKRDSQRKTVEDKKAFFKDQSNLNGNTGNRWSSITLRIALAIYHRSASAYKALQSFDILKLPSEMTLKRRSKNFMNEPGIDYGYFHEQETKYSEFIKTALHQGKPTPMADGVLIFDEVKVIEKVIWNSKAHKFIGFAMEQEEFSSLKDVFPNSKEPQPTQYVLQYLWRDLTSGFDMIGPYYTFGTSPNGDDIVNCSIKTMQALNSHGFGVLCIVCDGASSNLSAIKKLMEWKGTFSCEPSDAHLKGA